MANSYYGKDIQDMTPDELDELQDAIREQSPESLSFQDPGQKTDDRFGDAEKAVAKEKMNRDAKTPFMGAAPSPLGMGAYNDSALDAILNPVRLDQETSQGEDLLQQYAPESEPEPTPVAKGKPSSVNPVNATPVQQVPDMPVMPPNSTPDDLAAAMEQRRKDMAMAMVMQGIHEATSAHGGIKSDVNFTKGLEGMANQPVSDIQELRKADQLKLAANLEKDKNDPSSQSSAMARDMMKTMLGRIGYKGLADKITDNVSAKQLEDRFGGLNIQNLMTQYETQQNRLELQKMKQAQLAETAQAKLDDKDTKRLDQANKIIQAGIARNNTAFGRSAGIIRSAEALENLIANVNPKDINSRQIYEMASGLDAMLSSGASTVSGREHLIPQTFSKDKAKITEYISGKPKGAGQEAFVHQMMETVAREKELAKQQIQREAGKMLSSYADLRKKSPEAWNLMLSQNELPADLFNEPQSNAQQKNTAPKEVAVTKQYDPKTEAGIASFMAAHPELKREEALKILKDAGKIK